MNAVHEDSGILFVSGTLEVGGSETKVVRIANELMRSGYSSAIAYLNPPDTLLDKVESGVPVFHLQRRGKYSLRSFRQLQDLIAGTYRIVVSVNFYPLLYVLPAIKFGSSFECTAIGLINTTDFVDGQRLYGPIYSPFLRRCDQLVFGCEAQLRLWTRKYGLSRERSRFIYNGVDSDFYSDQLDSGQSRNFRREHDIPIDAFVIGSIGRFAPEKHFSLLIEALGRLTQTGRDAYLILVGEGDGKACLEEAAKEHGVPDKVRFPGLLSDVRPAIQSMSLFVLPSRAVETFSNAALEAMAMARPVVLSDIGGAAEMVEHMKSGILFEVADINGLSEILAMLYDSRRLREQLGRAARERVMERFQFDVMLDGYKALFDSVV